MAKSQRRTTIAILRGILGSAAGAEERFAKLANRSVSWVKKASAGLMPLSEETARVLQLETGISFDWLMGPADKLPVDTRGKPYRHERYEWIRARNRAGDPVSQTGFKPLAFLPDIAAIGSAAGDHGKAAIFLWRLKFFIEQQRKQFGSDARAHRFVSKLLVDNPKVSNFAIHDKGLNVAEIESLVQRTVDAAKKKPKENQSQQSSRKIRKDKSTKTPSRHARSRRGGNA
jgi:hypothetical protein